MKGASASDTNAAGRARRYLKNAAERAWSAAAGIFPAPDDPYDPILRTTAGLMKTLLQADDGVISEAEIAVFQEIFKSRYNSRQVELLTRMLRQCDPVSPEQAAKLLADAPREQALTIFRMLDELAAAESSAQQQVVREMAAALRLTDAEASAVKQDVGAGRRKILKSGAGMLVALIVIGVFIATATVLKSVVFGLILAYIFLPLEGFYERRLAGKYNPVHWGFAAFDWVMSPLVRMARHFAGRGAADEEILKLEEGKRRTSRATVLTVLTVLAVIGGGIFFVSDISAGYVARLGGGEQSVGTAPAAGTEIREAAESEAEAFIDTVINRTSVKVEELKERFASLGPVRMLLERISGFLARDDAGSIITKFLASRTSGIFSFTAGFFSVLGSIILDLLLTIFFFALLLGKLAASRRLTSRDENYSRYIVRTVFNGKWLPLASEEAMTEAQTIIEQIIFKLKVWLRGYLVLMIVDCTVYTTAFYFLKVPYFPLFGFIAACGVLLPYVGPVAAAAATALVTLALGGDGVTGMQILGILGIYLWQNGIVDQFFLYPLIIGDALELSAMETIIVVLLGGIFAGIPGMIFAMPAAAIIKYLVPQIYKLWK